MPTSAVGVSTNSVPSTVAPMSSAAVTVRPVIGSAKASEKSNRDALPTAATKAQGQGSRLGSDARRSGSGYGYGAAVRSLAQDITVARSPEVKERFHTAAARNFIRAQSAPGILTFPPNAMSNELMDVDDGYVWSSPNGPWLKISSAVISSSRYSAVLADKIGK